VADIFYPDLSGNGKGVVDLEEFPELVEYSGSGMRTAGSIAELQGMEPGGAVFLIAVGKIGIWEWTNDDISALVALDVYQGLYAASTYLNTTGGWVRRVEGNRFLLSWWKHALFSSAAQTVINTISQLIENYIYKPTTIANRTLGAVLVWNEAVTTTGPIQMFSHNLWLEGVPGGKITRTGNYHSLIMWGVNTKVSDIHHVGTFSNSGSGNPACILWINPYDHLTAAPAITERYNFGFEASGNYIENTSLGILLTGSVDNTGTNPADGTVVAQNLDARIHHNTIYSNLQCLSAFNSDNLSVHDNTFDKSKYAAVNLSFSTVVRLLGCWNAHVHHNVLVGKSGAGDNSYFNLSLMQGGIPGSRRANKNITIDHNTCSGANIIGSVNECQGSFVFDNNTIDGVTHTEGFRFFSTIDATMNARIDDVFITENKFNNFYAFFCSVTSGGPLAGVLEISGNTFKATKGTAHVAGDGRLLNAVFSLFQIYIIKDNKVIWPDGDGKLIDWRNSPAGTFMIIEDNLFPRDAAANGPITIDPSTMLGSFVTEDNNNLPVDTFDRLASAYA
jgi:hypothetical protein